MQLEKVTPDGLGKCSDDEVKNVLKSCFALTVHAIQAAAIAVRELDRRGVDFSDVQVWMIGYIRAVGAGNLSASALMRFAGKRSLLNRIVTLPIQEQERLASGEPVDICISKNDSAKIDPLEMSAEQISLVFPLGKRRSVSEQRAIMLTRDVEKPTPKTRVTIELSEDEYEIISAKAVASGESVSVALVREIRKKKIV